MDLRIRTLLSLQRSLLDIVTPNLRGVAVRYDPLVVRSRFLFENPPAEDDLENVSEAETYTIADFQEGVSVEFSAVWLPTSQARDLLEGEHWVYLRKE